MSEAVKPKRKEGDFTKRERDIRESVFDVFYEHEWDFDRSRVADTGLLMR